MTVATIVLTAVVLALLYDRGATRVATERERAALLQRIQAPERAVAEHAGPARKIKRAVAIPLDDDKAMSRVMEGKDPDADAA